MTETTIGGLRVRNICELALRRVGQFPAFDQEADPALMAIAAEVLDMVLKHTAGKTNNLWLNVTVPITVTTELTSGDLLTLMGSQAPEGGYVAPVSAFVRNSSGVDDPVKILRRYEYEAIEAKTTTFGRLQRIYIDRTTPRPTIKFLEQSSDETQTLYLTFETFHQDNRGRPIDKQLSGLRPDLDLWIVTELAYWLGSGYVTTLPDGELKALDDKRASLWIEVAGRQNQEEGSEPSGRVRYNEF